MVGGQADAIEVDGHPGIETSEPGEGTDLELTGRSETSLFYTCGTCGALSSWVPRGAGCAGRAGLRTAVLDDLTYEEIVDPEADPFQG